MRTIILVIAFTFSIAGFAFAESNSTPVTSNLARAITIGNSTCIPLSDDNRIWSADKFKIVKMILEIKQGFEEKHPELKITGWHETSMHGSFLYLWIDHEPRRKK